MAKLTRWLALGLLGLAGYYLLFGGQYSVFELRNARTEFEVARVQLDSMRALTDSLRARADSLEGDLATLERIARERFGMIRDRETLYRFTAPARDTTDSVGG